MQNNNNEEKWNQITNLLKNSTQNLKMIEKDINTLEKIFQLNHTKNHIKTKH